MEITTVIYVNAIDERMIGKNICGFTLCKVYVGDNSSEHIIDNSIPVWKYANRLFDYHYDEINHKFAKNDNNGDYYLYFMKKYEVKSMEEAFDETYDEAYNFIDSLILFKQESLQLSQPYCLHKGIVNTYIKLDLFRYYVQYPYEIYCLSDDECNEIKQFYDTYSAFKNNEKTADIKNMIKIYFQARRIEIREVRFILLITVIEMFLGVSSEISNQISKGVATLMADNYEEHERISVKMKNIYNARSKYIHNGKKEKITMDIYDECNKYVLLIIKKLIEYNVKYNLSLKEIQDYIKNMGVLVTDLENKIELDRQNVV